MSDYKQVLNNAMNSATAISVEVNRDALAVSALMAESQQLLQQMSGVPNNAFQSANRVSLDVFTAQGEPMAIKDPSTDPSPSTPTRGGRPGFNPKYTLG